MNSVENRGWRIIEDAAGENSGADDWARGFLLGMLYGGILVIGFFWAAMEGALK